MFSNLGLPDEGRDALMSAALDPPTRALESWRRWKRSGADARTDPVARRWLPLIGHNLRAAPVDPPVRALFVEAVQIVQTSGERIDWDVVIAEAARRQLGLQMTHALRVVRERGHVDVPQAVIDTLEQQPVSWRERLECRFKGRPVQSAGGLFVIWTAWRRSTAAARAEGRQPPRWTRFLAAALGVATPAALVSRLAAHAWTRARAVVHRPPPRGASTRTRMVARR